ncbi:hypothetical protein J1614_011459 [Plenodomus biglobosus]|nr:hypothetical protein J1614_011459 [Plenodomus biglobosus]
MSSNNQTQPSFGGLFGTPAQPTPRAPPGPRLGFGSPIPVTPGPAQPVTQVDATASRSAGNTSNMSVFSQRACPQAVLKSYKSGDFTDLIVSCGDLTFNVHQVIVCSTCEFFKKSVNFRKEHQEKRINLPHDDPEMIRRLIAFCYLGNYDPSNDLVLSSFDSLVTYTSTTPIAPACHSRYRKGGLFASPDPCSCLMRNTGKAKQAFMSPTAKGAPSDYSTVSKPDHSVEVADPLTIHATMYALADKYQVDGLATLARDKFKSCLHHHANTNDFMNAVQIAYSSTPDTNRGLRDTVCEAFQSHFRVNLASIPGIESKLDCIDDLSFLLIKAWPVKTEPPTTTPPGASTGLFANIDGSSARFPTIAPRTSIAFGAPQQ